MLSVIGQVVTSVGMSQHADALGVIEDVAVVPAVAYLREQPADLPIYFDHDSTWQLGRIEYLERSEGLGLMAVGRIGADLADYLDEHGPWWFSDSILCQRLGDSLYKTRARLRELSLVKGTANCQTRPVVWTTGDLAGGDTPYGGPPMPLYWRATWARAQEALSAARYRRAPDHLRIVDLDPLSIEDEILSDPAAGKARVDKLRSELPHRPYEAGKVLRHNVGGRVVTFD